MTYQKTFQTWQAPAKVPPCPLSSIREARGSLIVILTPYIGKEIFSEDVLKIASEIRRKLNVDETAVVSSINFINGRVFTHELYLMLSYFIAGNIKLLEKGKIVSRWAGQRKAEWVAASICDVSSRSSFGKRLFCITLRVLSGSPAGLEVSRCFPAGFLNRLAGDLGFGRDKWHVDPKELYGLFIRVLLVPGDVLTFDDYKVIDKKLNKRHILGRKTPCPNGFQKGCYACPVGVQECQYACRGVTLIERACESGHMGWFDPRYPGRKWCEACYSRKEKSSVRWQQ